MKQEQHAFPKRRIDYRNFKRRLKEKREEVGLSQTEAARRIGVSRNTYLAWESGTTSTFPPVEALFQIVDVFRCRFSDLLSPEDGQFFDRLVEQPIEKALRNKGDAEALVKSHPPTLPLTEDSAKSEVWEPGLHVSPFRDPHFLASKSSVRIQTLIRRLNMILVERSRLLDVTYNAMRGIRMYAPESHRERLLANFEERIAKIHAQTREQVDELWAGVDEALNRADEVRIRQQTEDLMGPADEYTETNDESTTNPGTGTD